MPIDNYNRFNPSQPSLQPSSSLVVGPAGGSPRAGVRWIPPYSSNGSSPIPRSIMSRSVSPMVNAGINSGSIQSLQQSINHSMAKLNQAYQGMMLMHPAGGFNGLQGRDGVYYRPSSGGWSPVNANASNIPAAARQQFYQHHQRFQQQTRPAISSLYQMLAYQQFQLQQRIQQLASAGVKQNMSPQNLARLLPQSPQPSQPISLDDFPGVYRSPYQAEGVAVLPQGCRYSEKEGVVKGFPACENNWRPGESQKTQMPKRPGFYYTPKPPDRQQQFQNPFNIHQAWDQWLASNNYQNEVPTVFQGLQAPKDVQETPVFNSGMSYGEEARLTVSNQKLQEKMPKFESQIAALNAELANKKGAVQLKKAAIEKETSGDRSAIVELQQEMYTLHDDDYLAKNQAEDAELEKKELEKNIQSLMQELQEAKDKQEEFVGVSDEEVLQKELDGILQNNENKEKSVVEAYNAKFDQAAREFASEVKEEHKVLDEENRVLEAEIDQTKYNINSTEKKIYSTMAEIANLPKEQEIEQRQHGEKLRLKNAALEKKYISTLDDEIGGLKRKKQKHEMQQDPSSLTKEKEERSKELETLKLNVKNLDSENVRLNEPNKKTEKTLAQARSDFKTKETEIESQIKHNEDVCENTKTTNGDFDSQLLRLTKELGEENKQLSCLDIAVQKLYDDYKTVADEADVAEQRLQLLTNGIATPGSCASDTDAEIPTNVDEINKYIDSLSL